MFESRTVHKTLLSPFSSSLDAIDAWQGDLVVWPASSGFSQLQLVNVGILVTSEARERTIDEALGNIWTQGWHIDADFSCNARIFEQGKSQGEGEKWKYLGYSARTRKSCGSDQS